MKTINNTLHPPVLSITLACTAINVLYNDVISSDTSSVNVRSMLLMKNWNINSVMQSSREGTISHLTHEHVNFTLVLRDLLKGRLVVVVNQKRNAWTF